MQFNRGTSAMQHYVATRPMFIDVEIMNADTKLVLGDQAAQASPSNVARGLSSLYKEIIGLNNTFCCLQNENILGRTMIDSNFLQILFVKKLQQSRPYSLHQVKLCQF